MCRHNRYDLKLDLNDALVLYIDAASGGFADTSSFTDTADALVRGVHLGALDGPTLSRLAPWFERRDRFDRAEDVIFAWFDKESAPAEAAGLAFYERLWGLPDARLRAGGLSSQEVLDGLADLQAKARTEGGSS